MTYCTVPCIFPSQDFSASFCDFVLSVYNPRRELTQRFRIAATPITLLPVNLSTWRGFCHIDLVDLQSYWASRRELRDKLTSRSFRSSLS